METLKDLEALHLGEIRRLAAPILKQVWQFELASFQFKHLAEDLTELCSFDSYWIAVFANGAAFIVSEASLLCRLEIPGEQIVSISEINRQLVLLTQSYSDSFMRLRLVTDIDVVLDEASCNSVVDLAKLSVTSNESHQIGAREVVCFDRSCGRLIVKQTRAVLVINGLDASDTLQISIPELCSVDYACGYICVWSPQGAGTTLVQHVDTKSAACTFLTVNTAEPFTLCIPTANSIILKTAVSSTLALSLDGALSDLGPVAQIYISEADGDVFIVQQDGLIYCLKNTTLTCKITNSRVKCLAAGPYLFAMSQQAIQVLCRETMIELTKVTCRGVSKARCLHFDKETEELWIGDSKGKVGILG